MPSLIQKHAHVKGQSSNLHIFKFQPNPSWAKKRPNRYTSFVQINMKHLLYFNYSGRLNDINEKILWCQLFRQVKQTSLLAQWRKKQLCIIIKTINKKSPLKICGVGGLLNTFTAFHQRRTYVYANRYVRTT